MATTTAVTMNKPTEVARNIDDAIAKFPVALSQEQQQVVKERVQGLDFVSISQLEIVQAGSWADEALTKVLDSFLDKIDRAKDPRLFALFEKLNQDVDEAKLPELANKILNDELGFGDKMKSLFSKKAAREVVQRAKDEIDTLLRGTAGTLKKKVDENARELNTAMDTLRNDVQFMESLKQAYRERLADFTLAAAIDRTFVEIARSVVEIAEEELSHTVNPSPEQQAGVDALRSKLQTAESCAIAKEGTLTRLPADQLVITQIEQAGIATYIETLSTATTRFNNIKMTLLNLYGALSVKNVQDLNSSAATLDKNLSRVNSMLMKDVVTKAANAPGDNRLAQAEQIKAIVSETKKIQEIVNTARAVNKQKFADARAMLAQTRNEMIELSKQIQPNQNGKIS